MERKRMNGRLEDRATFLRRRYCDLACSGLAHRKERASKNALHKRAERFKKPACERCGTARNRAVHHIDHNPANNAPGNLMTLCGSCHTRWHWEHGKTRSKRQSVCNVCGEPARKLDMCQKHYQRFRKYGDPLLTKIAVGSRFVLQRVTS
jgi:hypothetical protein